MTAEAADRAPAGARRRAVRLHQRRPRRDARGPGPRGGAADRRRGARRRSRSPAAWARSRTCGRCATRGLPSLEGVISRQGAVRAPLHRRARRCARWTGPGLMVLKRVIPCLDVDKGRVVKGIEFVDIRDAGDPVELAARYQDEGADEIVFLDITASHERRENVAELARRCADEVFIPFTIGGRHPIGRGRPGGARRRLGQGVGELRGRGAPGADRRAGGGVRGPVRGAGHRRPQARRGRRLRGGGARRAHRDRAARPWSGRARAPSAGRGRSCSRAWTATAPRTGTSWSSPASVADAVDVPVIASGGAGTLDHLVEAVDRGGADAVLCASIFHYGQYSVRRGQGAHAPPPASPCAHRRMQRVSSSPTADLSERVAALPGMDRLLPALDGLAPTYLVGGAVRDLLVGQDSVDLDLTVEGDGVATARELAQRLGGEASEHERFGTATVRAGELTMDLATARRESYAAPRRPARRGARVARGGPGAARLHGERDGDRPVGAGAGRAARPGRRLRRPRRRRASACCTTAASSTTRPACCARCATRPGWASAWSADTERLAREAVAANALSTVSGPRVRDELMDLLGEPAAPVAVGRMRDLGVAAALAPAAARGPRAGGLRAARGGGDRRGSARSRRWRRW